MSPPLKQESSSERFTRIVNEARARKEKEDARKAAPELVTIPSTSKPILLSVGPTTGENKNDNINHSTGSSSNNTTASTNRINGSTLSERLAALRNKSAILPQITLEQAEKLVSNFREAYPKITETAANTLSTTISDLYQGIGRTGEAITYNEKQLSFIQTAGTGESCILIGAAGTGKTTCMRGTIQNLIQNGIAGLLQADGHKHLPETEVPGVVVCAYTRRATANIRRQLSDDMRGNCLTIHKLLEYEPVYYDVVDPETGEDKTTMKFEPTRNAGRPLPASIRCIVIEEGSMVSVELFKELTDALPHKPQFIFLGDIQQLPPVFGSAILGYKMLELKTVELTEVYRQALESPIIRLAHRILSGKPIPATEYAEWKVPGKLTIHPWKKKLHPDTGLLTAAKFFTSAIDSGSYDPEEDQILIPYNKSFGTIELNKHIAQHLARARKAYVYEVIAGFNRHYLSVGDKVLVDKEDGIIVDITENPAYAGAKAQKHSLTMDYWGYDSGSGQEIKHHLEVSEAEVDFMLDQAASSSDEDRVRKCSHIIRVQMLDSGVEINVDAAADVNNMLLGYALTVHKSQGSEWRKVFLVLHQSHAVMLQRELLYTAITRAKEELYVICEPESFTRGIESQRIKGNTLAEKAEFFKGKIANGSGNGKI